MFDCRNRRIRFQLVKKHVSCRGIMISDENAKTAHRISQRHLSYLY